MLLSPELRARLERLSLRTRGRVRGKWAGRHASKQIGESIDFADYREYVPGDDFRRIDHNLRARLGVVMVRLFEAEDELPLRVIVDTSASMGFGAKFRVAQELAAVMSFLALAGGDRVYPIRVPGSDGRSLATGPPSRHLSGWPVLEGWLEGLTPGGAGTLTPAMHSLLGNATVRGPVVLISDLFDPAWEKSMDAMGTAGSGTVLHVLAPNELEPDLSGDLRLIDSESRQAVDLSTSSDALAAYRTARDAFLTGAAARARRAGLDYVLVPAEPGAAERTLSALAAVEAVR